MPTLARPLPSARARPAHRTRAVHASAAPTAIVTGASPNSIGVETAKGLAARGYDVTLACRDLGRARAAADQVAAAAANGGSVRVAALDLADLASVRAFADGYVNGADAPLSLLINNAGVMACPAGVTRDGFETQFGTNHLGHYVLTLRLLPLLLDPATPARVITLASSAHQFGHIDFDDLNWEARRYSAWGAYGASKLANVLFAAELARRVPRDANVTSNSVHPGVVNTELARHLIDPATAPSWQRPLFALTARFLKTPAQGAETSLHVATSPDTAGVTGKYFADSAIAKSTAEANDLRVASRLWTDSARLTGEDGTAGGRLVGAMVAVAP